MMIIRSLAILFLLVTFSVPAHANRAGLAIGIASNHIDITVGFNGSTIELFGNRSDQNTEIAIVVEGPKKDVTIWQKARIMGTWVNSTYLKFNDMPMYYNYAISAGDIDEPLLQLMAENGIGHDALFKKVKHKKSKKLKDKSIYHDAFLLKNRTLGTFFAEPVDIKFLNENFFRASFKVPPSAPTGEYKIHSYLIKDNKISEYNVSNLTVRQVGLNAFINKSAHDYGFIYALVCIFLALFSGWFISVLKVKP